MTHSVLRYMTTLSNTRYLMFNIYSAAEENTLYYVALKALKRNFNQQYNSEEEEGVGFSLFDGGSMPKSKSSNSKSKTKHMHKSTRKSKSKNKTKKNHSHSNKRKIPKIKMN